MTRVGALNTDDWPGVTFMAPKSVYAKQEAPEQRFYQLLKRSLELSTRGTNSFETRLYDYRRAGLVYFEGLIKESEGQLPMAVSRFIESARVSPEFTYGYSRALTIAGAEAKTNPTVARNILGELIKAQPERQAARELLVRISR